MKEEVKVIKLKNEVCEMKTIYNANELNVLYFILQRTSALNSYDDKNCIVEKLYLDNKESISYIEDKEKEIDHLCCRFTTKEIKSFLKRNITKKELDKILYNVFKKDVSIKSDNSNKVANIFSSYEVNDLGEINFIFNDFFMDYIIMTKNSKKFSLLELVEYSSLKSVKAKNLYALVMRFKNIKGSKFTKDIKEFKEIVGISNSYKISDVHKTLKKTIDLISEYTGLTFEYRTIKNGVKVEKIEIYNMIYSKELYIKKYNENKESV